MATRINAYPSRPGQTAGTSDGSRTMTMHDVPTGEQGGGSGQGGGEEGEASPLAGVLRLRGGGNTRRVVWSEETVDNEGMGKKKSKICCIYHKPKAFDESSDESSGSSDSGSSDSDSDSPLSDASSGSVDSGVNASKSLRQSRAEGKKKSNGGKECEGDGEEGHGCSHRSKKKRGGGGGTRSRTVVQTQHDPPQAGIPKQRPAPNAYEQGLS